MLVLSLKGIQYSGHVVRRHVWMVVYTYILADSHRFGCFEDSAHGQVYLMHCHASVFTQPIE